MTATTLTIRQRLYQGIVGDVLELVAAQPHQTLISSASVAIVASEAAALVPLPFNVLMAIGAEWAYLRGLASSPKGSKGWVTALNWGALTLVVLYGMLWGARKFGALPAVPEGWEAWGLTALHILPVAFLSLAAAMVHRSAVEAEGAERATREREAEQCRLKAEAEEEDRQRRRQAKLDEIEAMRLQRLAEVETMEAAAQARLRLRQASRETVTTPATEGVTGSVTEGVTPRHDAAKRAEAKAAIVTLIRAGGELNVSQEARTLGISRGLWYKLVDEARAEGLL